MTPDLAALFSYYINIPWNNEINLLSLLFDYGVWMSNTYPESSIIVKFCLEELP